MTPTTTTLTTKVETGSPYQLDPNQTLQASTALLKHIKAELERTRASTTKKSLLTIKDDTADSESEGDEDDVVIWQIFTLKKLVVDKNRLKPTRIPLPHSLNTSPSLQICLITADPQREVKDVIADPAFPAELRSRITRVIGFAKLKARYKSYESRRQLKSEHDIFMVDDRIDTRLPETLGKTFYSGGKKPMSVKIATPERVDGKDVKKDKRKNPEQHHKVKKPTALAEEIGRALSSTLVFLTPNATTAVKVGKSNFTAEQLAMNIDVVTSGMIDRGLVKGWRNMKAMHIKGPNTMAMPIWLADELWAQEEDVLENGEGTVVVKGVGKKSKKRKAEEEVVIEPTISKQVKKEQSAENEAAEKEARKAKLLKQKSDAMDDVDEFATLMKRVKSSGADRKKLKVK